MTFEGKPIGRKNYGGIPHLPGSRLGPADHHCAEGQARICLEKARDKDDHSRLRAVYGENIARLRALAAGGAP